MKEHGAAARSRLAPHFRQAGIDYPPAGVTLLALKEARVLEAHVPESRSGPVLKYPILRLSGGPGPKLREGDRQVPEGRYRVTYLNPNSRYHLSLRLDYPNRDDRENARRDGRTDLGGDIMIHGGSASIGCLAMGDPAIEELFVLVADVGLSRVRVLIAPVDFRSRPRWTPPAGLPPWTGELYSELRSELNRLR